MTVKDLFSACDSALLVKRFCEADGVIDEEEAEHLRQRLDKITPAFSEENIILGTEYVSSDEELPPRIEITVYRKADISENFRQLSVSSDSFSYKDFSELSEIIAAVGGHSPELMMWSDIFGCELDGENVQRFGNERFMAEIMCAMTCYGYSQAEIDRARAKTGANISLLSGGESADDTMSLDKMAMLLFGGELPESNEPHFSSETAANMLSTYNVLREYCKNMDKCH